MGRRAAREEAFKLLFQIDIQKGDIDEQIGLFFQENNFDESQKTYISEVIKGTAGVIEKIDNEIEKNLKGWKISRISKTDLAILRLAVFEIKFRNDIPPNVSINEAVELAKKYSPEESGAFVNGILAKVIV